MKKKEFDKVLAEAPIWVPLFQIIKVPTWARHIKKGDYVYPPFTHDFGASHLRFVRYQKIN